MTDYSQLPQIEVFGITLLEPFTVLTDLIITAVAWYAFFKIRGGRFENPVHRLKRWFFFTMGLATAVGGILGHGLMYLYDMESKVPGWFISMISVALFERAAIFHARQYMGEKIGKIFSWINLIELCTFMFLAAYFLKFIFVEIHAIYGLFIVVFSFEMYVYQKTRDKGSYYIFIGTAWATGAALSHAMRISLHEWFNHNDVSHLGMAMAVYFYYKASLNFTVYSTKTS
jgi:hypothetical protein